MLEVGLAPRDVGVGAAAPRSALLFVALLQSPALHRSSFSRSTAVDARTAHSQTTLLSLRTSINITDQFRPRQIPARSFADPRLVATGPPHIRLPRGVDRDRDHNHDHDHDHANRPHLFLRCRPQLESEGTVVGPDSLSPAGDTCCGVDREHSFKGGITIQVQLCCLALGGCRLFKLRVFKSLSGVGTW